MSDRKQATLTSYFGLGTFESVEHQLKDLRITKELVPRISIFDFIEKVGRVVNPRDSWAKYLKKDSTLHTINKGEYNFQGIFFLQ